MPPRKRTITAKRVTGEAAETMAAVRERLTLPEPLPPPPVIITDAERAASDAYIDELRAARAQDQDTLDGWLTAAEDATYGPLEDWLRQAATLPAMLP